MLDLSQFKADIVRPVLSALALPGDLEARVQLTTGIALVESGLRYIRQVGGPALGICQMEPATHYDMWQTFFPSRPDLGHVVSGYLPARFSVGTVASAAALEESLAYSVAMAACRFFRSPVLLPARGDAAAMCAAWKAGYNTSAGKGVCDAARVALFQKAVEA